MSTVPGITCISGKPRCPQTEEGGHHSRLPWQPNSRRLFSQHGGHADTLTHALSLKRPLERQCVSLGLQEQGGKRTLRAGQTLGTGCGTAFLEGHHVEQGKNCSMTPPSACPAAAGGQHGSECLVPGGVVQGNLRRGLHWQVGGQLWDIKTCSALQVQHCCSVLVAPRSPRKPLENLGSLARVSPQLSAPAGMLPPHLTPSPWLDQGGWLHRTSQHTDLTGQPFPERAHRPRPAQETRDPLF